MPPNKLLVDELAIAFDRLETGLLIRKGDDPRKKFAVYAEVLGDANIDPMVLRRAVKDLLARAKFFPIPAELLMACRVAADRKRKARRLEDAERAQERRERGQLKAWGYGPYEPCPNCNKAPVVTETPCPAAALPEDATREQRRQACPHQPGHRHGTYTVPPCNCWDASGLNPQLSFSLLRATYSGAHPKPQRTPATDTQLEAELEALG